MDLNRLYSDHQIALIGSASNDAEFSAESRRDALCTASRIMQLQHSLGAPAAQGWEALCGDVLPLASRPDCWGAVS